MVYVIKTLQKVVKYFYALFNFPIISIWYTLVFFLVALTWNSSRYCFLSVCFFTWNTAGASIASSSLKVMVKGQKCKDKDKTPLLQGSIQFSLIRQSCHWNQWQLSLNKKGWIGISVVWVCNLTTCPTWQERTSKRRTNRFSQFKTLFIFLSYGTEIKL